MISGLKIIHVAVWSHFGPKNGSKDLKINCLTRAISLPCKNGFKQLEIDPSICAICPMWGYLGARQLTADFCPLILPYKAMHYARHKRHGVRASGDGRGPANYGLCTRYEQEDLLSYNTQYSLYSSILISSPFRNGRRRMTPTMRQQWVWVLRASVAIAPWEKCITLAR